MCSFANSVCLLINTAEAYLTAYQALVLNGRMKDGETVLIHAVSAKDGFHIIYIHVYHRIGILSSHEIYAYV